MGGISSSWVSLFGWVCELLRQPLFYVTMRNLNSWRDNAPNFMELRVSFLLFHSGSFLNFFGRLSINWCDVCVTQRFFSPGKKPFNFFLHSLLQINFFRLISHSCVKIECWQFNYWCFVHHVILKHDESLIILLILLILVVQLDNINSNFYFSKTWCQIMTKQHVTNKRYRVL